MATNIANIEFYKMSGAGNDFIVVDNREKKIDEKYKSELAKKICERRISIGADGFLLVELSDKASFKMSFFNRDGSEGEMCGNGARCIARYAFLKGIVDKKMKIETKSGIIEAEILGNNVKLKMNPITKIELNKKINVDGEEIELCYIEEGMPGLPHAVILRKDLNLEEDIEEIGKKIRYHEDFPKGTNVNFSKILGEKVILNRTYERGVERETLACGTGAVATASCAYLLKKCNKEIIVKTKGGILNVTIAGKNLKEIYLIGDARVVYKGKFTDESF